MEQYRCTKEGGIARLDSEVKTLFKEVDALKNIQNTIIDLTSNITRLVEQMRETKEDVKSIKEDVEELKSVPADNYKHYKRLIIGVIITAVISFVAGKIL